MEKIRDLRFTKYLHPTQWGYNAVVPVKTEKMVEYEKKTGKRSIAKIIDKPSIHKVKAGEYKKGKIQLTNGFIEWSKKNRKNKKLKKINLINSALKQLEKTEKERKLNPAQRRRRDELKRMIKKIQPKEKIEHKKVTREEPIIIKKTVNELKQRILHLKTTKRKIRNVSESIYQNREKELRGLKSELMQIENLVRDPILNERVVKLERKGFTRNQFKEWIDGHAHISDVSEYWRTWDRIKKEKVKIAISKKEKQKKRRR